MQLAWGLIVAVIICNRLQQNDAVPLVGGDRLPAGDGTQASDEEMAQLRQLLSEIVLAVRLESCFVIVTDDTYHHQLYGGAFFHSFRRPRTYFYLRVHEAADLLAPDYQTVRVLKQIRYFNCDLHLVTLRDGVQVKRLLRFVEKNRILNLGQKFVFLHDARLLEPDTLAIWGSMLSSIFLKRRPDSYSISSVSYGGILNGLVVTKQLAKWKAGQRVQAAQVFPAKSSNLGGVQLPVVVFEHVPMVRRGSLHGTYVGLEVEIVRALGVALNFEPVFYESADTERERWGRELPNGSFTGLIGQLTKRIARIAIGDLHFYQMYFDVMDLSWPHSHECLTFLTPESSQDNSWRTLIQPFSGGMWAGVLLSLFVVGGVFYFISYLHAVLLYADMREVTTFFMCLRKKPKHAGAFNARAFRDVRFRAQLNRWYVPPRRQDLFDSFANCILLTYSMLMYVALPRMPLNWPLRVLTGWYWIYCILLTVTYRASFTAILANPAARITIDTLADLDKSQIAVTAWVKENKLFFDEAFDDVAQEVGSKMELIDDVYGITDRIAQGHHAYYDNEYFLRHLRLSGAKSRTATKAVVLHIMRECVVYMPVALGLEKNSPLKPHIDKYIQRLSEGGFIAKWLQDAVSDLPTEEQSLPEALMDFSKIWSSFIALGIGYFISVCAIIAEKLHFRFVVCRHPLYDRHNPRLYYNFKRKFPNF